VLHSTRYSTLSPVQARLALALLAATIVSFINTPTPRTNGVAGGHTGDTDSDLFRQVVHHIHAGESTQDAFEQVFKTYNYPVRSVFNYRTPLHLWLIGTLPDPVWGQAILATVIIVTSLAAYTVLRRDGSQLRAIVAMMMMLGAFVYCFIDDMYLYAEVWAGTLITLSVCAYALNCRCLGFGTGLIAIFFRELALPYGVFAGLIAWRQSRRREAAAWAMGLTLYGLYFTLHVLAVVPRLPPDSSLINATRWVHFDGLGFILATCRINLLLLASPSWIAALYLPLSLLGIVGWPGETSVRMGTLSGFYLLSFAVVGSTFVAYWGLMYAPLLPFGLVWAPLSLRDLWARASFSTATGSTQSR
jgi:hypothetical protein